jgi:hypothetical protein
VLLQSLYPHTVLSLLSFSDYLDPFGDLVFLLPLVENMDAPLLSFYSRKFLTESSRYPRTQGKLPQWMLPSASDLKEFPHLVSVNNLPQRLLAGSLIPQNIQ